MLIKTEEQLGNAVFIGEETPLSTDAQGMTSYATLPTYYQYLYDLESGALFCVFVGQAA